MNEGLIWYDANPKATAVAKLATAVAAYAARYNRYPTECHVALGTEFDGGDVRVVGDRWIRPDFFWLGRAS